MTDLLVESRAPVDNLVRARHDTGTIELRADTDGGTGRTLYGHFAVFNQWAEINSKYEGRFMERIAPGAFARTFAERGDRIRILYDHGADPSIGNKPLAAPTVLREDKVGAYYEAELFDAPYVNDLLPALRAGQLGASFRFRVTGEEWVDPPAATRSNPERLPERTVTDLDQFEFGPVTFPAYFKASSGVRSGTDEFIERLLNDPLVMARFTQRADGRVVEQLLASLPTLGRNDDTDPVIPDPVEPPTDDAPADGGSDESPDATVDDQTEGNRTQIAEALKRFRQHTKES